MSDQAQKPAEQPAAAPAPAQVVDVAKIAEQAAAAATAAATKIAEQKASEVADSTRKAIARQIAGEPEKPVNERALEELVKDPVRSLRVAVDVAKKEIREEEAVQKRLENTQRQVVGAVIQEYPGLNSEKKLAAVERFAADYEAQGVPYAEALKKACDDAVKEFGLKSVSETQRENGYRAGLPGGGGASSPGASAFDDSKSQSSFLDGMRSRMNSFRTKRA
jgi:hypothetical protein